MEIRFKSSEYNEDEVVKSFQTDFKTSHLIEDEYKNFKKGVTGGVKEFQVNNILAFFQNYTTDKPHDHTLQVVQNESLFLLQFVINGNFSISVEGENQDFITIKHNKYNLLYLPASKHLFTYHNQNKQILNIYFTESFLEQKMDLAFIKNAPDFINAKRNKKLYSFFKDGLYLNTQLRNIVNELLNCSFDGITKKSYLESKLTELILVSLHTEKPRLEKFKKEDLESLLVMENYIKSHLNEELNIEKLSLLVGFNTSKFKTLFKEHYGMPVFKYITSVRIEKAIELISKNNYTISQASYEVGYKNPQHFTVAFKKKLGYLPSQLIKSTN